MNKRLQQFLAAENISQSQFADTIGVARASISHIVAGRNKPGFDFLESMARHYPDLNLAWLIAGRGRMYNEAKTAPEPPAGHDPALETAGVPPLFPPDGSPAETTVRTSPASQKISMNKLDNIEQSFNNHKDISKIIVFYSDGSYQEIP